MVVDLTCGVFGHARVLDDSVIAVKLGFDLWLEMSNSEARAFSEQRAEMLEQRCTEIDVKIRIVEERKQILEQGLDLLSSELIRMQILSTAE